MTRKVLTGIAALATGACVSLWRPPLAPQVFSIDPPTGGGAPSAAGAYVIGLRRVELAPQLDDTDLLYRTGEHRLERDPYANFAASLGAMLTEAIRGYLRNAHFVRDVVEPGGELPADLLVEIYASDVSGDFSQPEAPAAVMSLRVLVLPAHTAGQPALLGKEYSRRTRLPRRAADALVAAWNQELADIMRQFQGDLETAVARASSDSGGACGR